MYILAYQSTGSNEINLPAVFFGLIEPGGFSVPQLVALARHSVSIGQSQKWS
jgi:hypothetical protein